MSRDGFRAGGILWSAREIRVAVLLVVLASIVWAATPPTQATGANPRPFELQQPGGSSFMARLWGDEWMNGVETLDGYTIVREPQSGRWTYAERNPAGRLVPSGVFVGQNIPPGLPRHLRPSPQAVSGGPAQPQATEPGFAKAPPTSGIHRLLVIVADFTPSQSLGTTEDDWEKFFFSGGGTYTPTSVKHYWDTVSYGTLNLQPAAESYGTANNGIVFVTLNYAHPNPGGGISDTNRQITRDALIAADPFVNFASFDTNADAFLKTDELHIYVIVRGYEGSSSTCTDRGTVWGHKWSLGFGTVLAPVLDGVTVGHFRGSPPPSGPYQGGYMQQGEWFCFSSNPPGHISTIGVAAHEMGHDLGTGLPDLYDTGPFVGTSSKGIGAWGLQGTGNWNGFNITGLSGTHPAFPDPWSRWFLGFLTPTQITSTQFVALGQIETATGANRGVFQLLNNPGGVDWPGGLGGEYFLIENRQPVGYDQGLPGHGLLIWHVDESTTNMSDEGTAPPPPSRILALMQADGRFDLECYANPPNASQCNEGDATDPWKTGTATTFNDSSTPNSKLYIGDPSGVAVTGIGPSSSTMSATLSPTGGGAVSPTRRRQQTTSE